MKRILNLNSLMIFGKLLLLTVAVALISNIFFFSIGWRERPGLASIIYTWSILMIVMCIVRVVPRPKDALDANAGMRNSSIPSMVMGGLVLGFLCAVLMFLQLIAINAIGIVLAIVIGGAIGYGARGWLSRG